MADSDEGCHDGKHNGIMFDFSLQDHSLDAGGKE